MFIPSKQFVEFQGMNAHSFHEMQSSSYARYLRFIVLHDMATLVILDMMMTLNIGDGKEFAESYTLIGIFRLTKAWSASRVYLHCGPPFGVHWAVRTRAACSSHT